MHPLIRRILRFDFRGKRERADALAEILTNLGREGKIQIYETYEDGEWDFCVRRIDNQEEGEVKSELIGQGGDECFHKCEVGNKREDGEL